MLGVSYLSCIARRRCEIQRKLKDLIIEKLKLIPGTMISSVKLRKIVKDHKPNMERLDEILARKPHFLDINKREQLEELGSVDFRNSDVFHRAVAPILAIAQCLAIMPVVGVTRPNPKSFRFTVRCPQFLLASMFIAAGMFFITGMLRKLFQTGVDTKNIVGIVFFLCAFFANILFLSLAGRWPKLIQYWSKVELIFLKKPYVIPKRNLASRVQLSAVIIIFLSAVEHGFYYTSAVYSYNKYMALCNSTQGPSFSHFMKTQYDYIFHMVPYNVGISIALLIINGTFTFTWNYMDLFIMMVSKGIAYRFEQITVRIKQFSGKEIPEYVFSNVREHYVQLCELLEYVDENLSGIILLSCMNNLYFVCNQLLNIFNQLRWPINYIYFWYSLLYLISRTAFVFLSAASINDESTAPVGVLRRVSQRTWCIEVERLIFQMTKQTVALSGKKFYYLTRRLLFGMAGTIVTYELVLLQFDEPNRAKGLPDLCS